MSCQVTESLRAGRYLGYIFQTCLDGQDLKPSKWSVRELSWINGFCCDYFYKIVPLLSPFSQFPLFSSSQLRLLLTSQERVGSTTSRRNVKNKTATHGRTSGWLPMSRLIDTQSLSCKSWLTWPPALMASAFLSSKSKRRGRSWRPTSTAQSLSRSNCAKVLKIHWRS